MFIIPGGNVYFENPWFQILVQHYIKPKQLMTRISNTLPSVQNDIVYILKENIYLFLTLSFSKLDTEDSDLE